MRTPKAALPFEDFVRARSSSLLRTALLLTGQNRAEAEDLLQVALERAYRHWSRISRSEEPERYVRRILANAATAGRRRVTRRPELSLQPTDTGPVAADHSAAIADRDYLLRSLAALPTGQRTVLVLRYFDDLSEAEIAQLLGCTPGTVKSQAARGLARLRDGAASGMAAQSLAASEAVYD